MAIIDTIREILEENQGIDPATVTEDATFESLGIDSLDTVELICELEERLDIDFGEPEGLTTLGEMVAYLETL
ncbi:MAG: acyl carrier protein [Eggerthellaceae bacterium]|nr:acyl carrier protein [Eggerthellaceae bacterium]